MRVCARTCAHSCIRVLREDLSVLGTEQTGEHGFPGNLQEAYFVLTVQKSPETSGSSRQNVI